MSLPPSLLHSLVPGHGIWATVLEVGLFVALLLAIFGAVVVSEAGLEGRTRWTWTALVLLVPVVGPLAYLLYRRRNGDGQTNR